MKPFVAPTPVPLPSIHALPYARGSELEGDVPVEILSPAAQAALLRVSELVELPAKTLLYAHGDRALYVYNVVEGLVETFCLLPDGDRRVNAFLFPHDLAGLSEHGRYVSSARTVSHTKAYRIPIEALEALLADDTGLDATLICKLCHDLRVAQRHAVNVSKREAEARLASFLLWLYRTHRDAGSPAGQLALPMPQIEIAAYLGLTVESVSRALRSLERDGLLARGARRSIVLRDFEALARVAGD